MLSSDCLIFLNVHDGALIIFFFVSSWYTCHFHQGPKKYFLFSLTDQKPWYVKSHQDRTDPDGASER